MTLPLSLFDLDEVIFDVFVGELSLNKIVRSTSWLIHGDFAHRVRIDTKGDSILVKIVH